MLYEIGVADDGTLVGLTRSEIDSSLNTLKKMGSRLKADVSIVRERIVARSPRNSTYKKNSGVHNSDNNKTSPIIDYRGNDRTSDISGLMIEENWDLGNGGYNSGAELMDEPLLVAEVLVRKCLNDDHHFLEIRVAIMGAADAGSTFLF